MVRDTRFKLVQRDGGSGPGELYNLEADPRERTNSYDDPDDSTVRDALAAELAKWRQSCSA
jgi:arylsulfatase A-like enzyme